MASLYRCNWNWCRETFPTTRELTSHLDRTHLNNIVKVKKEDWKAWVRAETAETQTDTFFDGVPTETDSSIQPSIEVGGRAVPSAERSPKRGGPSSSPPESPHTPSSRRRQSLFSDYNALSSPSPPAVGSDQPSPSWSDMIIGPSNGRSRSYSRSSRDSGSSSEDVEMQLTQPQGAILDSPTSSFRSQAKVISEPILSVDDNGGWKEGSFRFKRRSLATTLSNGNPVSQSQSQTEEEKSLLQSEAQVMGSQSMTVDYSPLQLQTQAPYFSQSLDSQGESQ
ncbi:hypothetical protein BXZ70DRAFT_1005895 [Cristinia sonorae]|uniref:C2H2-type domain-containing protein n=1 Tax=Cristinia sonorae TaxID=1940300 RepID=A0A8K0UU30_9AGAR|nr:hypothetical protein BXZ70DRAFT_1005895 [Cristinia sonorae]